MGECLNDGSTNEKKQFVIDEAAGTIAVEKKKFDFLMGVVPQKRYEKVRLFKETGKLKNESVHSWSVELIGN